MAELSAPMAPCAPIALFAYNRPVHLRRTVEALRANAPARQSDLIVYCDGAKGTGDEAAVAEARAYAHAIEGFRDVAIVERPRNLGLGESIISGVTATLERHERVIVMEDDLVTSAGFLQFMNDALELYRNEEKVISIHGYTYPVRGALPATFFLRGADCLGWATWRRGWALFERDGKALLDELQKRRLTALFDYNGARRHTRMLKEQAAGRLNSWAIRWYASAFVRERLTLYPGVSLVRHIGNDGTGTNYGVSSDLDVALAPSAPRLEAMPIVENPAARKLVEDYYRSVKKSLFMAGIGYLRRRFFSGRISRP